MISDCCGSRVVFHGVCSCCGERCRVVGENDSYLDIPDNDNNYLYNDDTSDDAYDAAVEAYWNGYGPPVTRRQREDEEMEREEYRRSQRGY